MEFALYYEESLSTHTSPVLIPVHANMAGSPFLNSCSASFSCSHPSLSISLHFIVSTGIRPLMYDAAKLSMLIYG